MISSALNAKKLIALSLCLSFLLTGGAWVVSDTNDTGNVATETDLSWEARFGGTRGDPILIRNVWDLQNMSNDLTADYALANDIDASATKDWNDGAGFEPVAPIFNVFTGSLDGRNYTISGLFIDLTMQCVGLFGRIGSGGSVSNVGMENVSITGTWDIGGLVGILQSGSVSNCYVTGSVTGYGYVGGLVGRNYQGSLSESYATGNVSGTDGIGGLMGINSGGSVSNSYATGSVKGRDDVGGLVGHNSGSVQNSHYNIDEVLINGGHHVTLGGLFHDQYQDWFENGMELVITDYDSTLVPSGSFYDISTLNGLRNLLGFAGTKGITFRLISDIDLSTAPGLYIPNLAANFEGNNHSISNLLIPHNFASRVGLFGHLTPGCSVSNVCLVDANVSGRNAVGGLVGSLGEGSVSNSYATGSVNGNMVVGGLVGSLDGGSVSDSYATGSVRGKIKVGGLVGSLREGVVSHSYATGSVNGTEQAGGLVGYNHEGSVENCYATGSVTRSSGMGTSFGGFMGENYQGKVTKCYSTGTVHYTGDPDPTDKGFCGKVDTGGGYEMTGNFWDTETSGQTSTAGNATGRTTAQMKTLSTFTSAGWDFDDVWCMIEDFTYPLLRWQDTESPVANAGPDQTVDEGATVTFNGTASMDNVGIVNYTWTFHDGVEDVSLYDVAPTHTFTVPGIYVVLLNVTDTTGNWNTDTLTIAVTDITPPVANAGPDQTVDEGTQVTFNGTASTDNVGIVNYTWMFNDGTGDMILYGVTPIHTFTVPGTYIVTLTVSDAVGFTDADTMTVTVNDTTPPTAHAGPDQTVDEGAQVTFDGSASTDNVGIANYTWTFNDGTGEVTLYGVAPTHTFTVPGVHIVTLKVIDAAGHNDTDTMTVTVNDITPPTAHAGPVQTVDEGTQVTFDGTESTDNVGIVNYTWTFHDGNRNVTLDGVAPNHTFTVPGNYTVILTVSDAAGLTDTDTMIVMVPGPVVIFDTVTLSPEQPKDGDTVTITVTLKNTGEATARSVDVTVKIGGTEITPLDFGDIAPGDTVTKDHAWTVQKGTYTLEVELSYAGGEDTHTQTLEVRKKSSDSPGFEALGALAAVGLAVVLFGKRRG